MADAFTENKFYTRTEIFDVLGGSKEFFLPHVNGHVVCGCFTKDLNPGAPSEVLPGSGPEIERWAHAFASQSEAVPIFLKKDVNEWQFMGLWRCVLKSLDPNERRAREQRLGRDVSMILKLEKI